MNKIAVHGVTGRAGSRSATELLSRGPAVNGIARNTAEQQSQAGLSLQPADASRAESLVPLLRGHHAVVSAMRFDGDPICDVLLQAIRVAGVPRRLVGGAGSLEVAPGVGLLDTPE